jgi:septal ring factor EnvC (AmiA/AmiB activator)
VVDTQVLVTVVAAGLALISGLILLVLNSMRASINRLEAGTTVRLDKQDAVIEKIKDALGELKDTLRDRQDGAKDSLVLQIEAIEAAVHQLETKMLETNVTKPECQHVVADLKQRIAALEKALKEVDAVTREQSTLLARIDQAVQSL